MSRYDGDRVRVMLNTGFWTAFHWRGVPVRVHWTLPAGALIIGGVHIVPGIWVGFIILVLLHEMGHAVLAWLRGARVLAIQLHGLGGECVHTGVAPLSQSIIAWGGVLAQALVLGATLLASRLLGPATFPFAAELQRVFVEVNVLLIAVNLLPFHPLDGGEAWKLFARLKQARLERRSKQRAETQKKKRRGGPDLRVVRGGAAEDDDKPRWLN